MFHLKLLFLFFEGTNITKCLGGVTEGIGGAGLVASSSANPASGLRQRGKKLPQIMHDGQRSSLLDFEEDKPSDTIRRLYERQGDGNTIPDGLLPEPTGQDDELADRPSFLPTVMMTFPARVQIMSVAAGAGCFGAHTLALTTEGKVYAWGFGPACGVNEGGDVGMPTLVTRYVGGDASGITMNGNHEYNWGARYRGRHRRSMASQAMNPTIAKVCAGNGFSLVLTDQGEVFSFGLSTNGRLGFQSKFHSQLCPRLLRDLDGVTDVSAGMDFGMVLVSPGRLFGFGANDSGQLGVGHLEDVYQPKMVKTPGHTIQFQSVSCGRRHCLALDSSGRVYSWGGAGGPELGLGSSAEAKSHLDCIADFRLKGLTYPWLNPRPVKALTGVQVVSVSAGHNHSMAVSDRGFLFVWGASIHCCKGLSTTSPSADDAPRFGIPRLICPGPALPFCRVDANVAAANNTSLITAVPDAAICALVDSSKFKPPCDAAILDTEVGIHLAVLRCRLARQDGVDSIAWVHWMKQGYVHHIGELANRLKQTTRKEPQRQFFVLGAGRDSPVSTRPKELSDLDWYERDDDGDMDVVKQHEPRFEGLGSPAGHPNPDAFDVDTWDLGDADEKVVGELRSSSMESEEKKDYSDDEDGGFGDLLDVVRAHRQRLSEASTTQAENTSSNASGDRKDMVSSEGMMSHVQSFEKKISELHQPFVPDVVQQNAAIRGVDSEISVGSDNSQLSPKSIKSSTSPASPPVRQLAAHFEGISNKLAEESTKLTKMKQARRNRAHVASILDDFVKSEDKGTEVRKKKPKKKSAKKAQHWDSSEDDQPGQSIIPPQDILVGTRAEAQQIHLPLHEFAPSVLHAFMKFIYTDTLDIKYAEVEPDAPDALSKIEMRDLYELGKACYLERLEMLVEAKLYSYENPGGAPLEIPEPTIGFAMETMFQTTIDPFHPMNNDNEFAVGPDMLLRCKAPLRQFAWRTWLNRKTNREGVEMWKLGTAASRKANAKSPRHLTAGRGEGRGASNSNLLPMNEQSTQSNSHEKAIEKSEFPPFLWAHSSILAAQCELIVMADQDIDMQQIAMEKRSIPPMALKSCTENIKVAASWNNATPLEHVSKHLEPLYYMAADVPLDVLFAFLNFVYLHSIPDELTLGDESDGSRVRFWLELMSLSVRAGMDSLHLHVQDELVDMIDQSNWVDILTVADALPRCSMLVEACMSAGTVYSLPELHRKLNVPMHQHPQKAPVRLEPIIEERELENSMMTLDHKVFFSLNNQYLNQMKMNSNRKPFMFLRPAF